MTSHSGIESISRFESQSVDVSKISCICSSDSSSSSDKCCRVSWIGKGRSCHSFMVHIPLCNIRPISDFGVWNSRNSSDTAHARQHRLDFVTLSTQWLYLRCRSKPVLQVTIGEVLHMNLIQGARVQTVSATFTLCDTKSLREPPSIVSISNPISCLLYLFILGHFVIHSRGFSALSFDHFSPCDEVSS